MDAGRLLGVLRPRAADRVAEIVGVDELSELLERKRAALRSTVLGDEATVHACGFLDTSNGLLLTSELAMGLARGKAARDKERREQKKLAELRKSLDRSRREKKERDDIDQKKAAAWRRRAMLAGKTEESFRKSVRSLSERRAKAKLLTALRTNLK